MAIVTVNPVDTFDTWRTKTNLVSTNLGDVSTLTTTATNAVGAVNEVSGHIGTLAALQLPGADMVAAVNEARRLAFAFSLVL